MLIKLGRINGRQFNAEEVVVGKVGDYNQYEAKYLD